MFYHACSLQQSRTVDLHRDKCLRSDCDMISIDAIIFECSCSQLRSESAPPRMSQLRVSDIWANVPNRPAANPFDSVLDTDGFFAAS